LIATRGETAIMAGHGDPEAVESRQRQAAAEH
jgi:hypothetical protein